MPRFALALVIALGSIGAALAADDPATAAETVAPSPLQAAIETALQEERAQVAALAAQLESAPDDAAALALHRAIEQAKRDGQLRVLGVQAEFARREGRLEDAQSLEAAIAAMGRPAAPAPFQPRPAPDTSRADGR